MLRMGLAALIVFDLGAAAHAVENTGLQVSLAILTLLGLAHVVGNEGLSVFMKFRARYLKYKEVRPKAVIHSHSVHHSKPKPHVAPAPVIHEPNDQPERPTVH